MVYRSLLPFFSHVYEKLSKSGPSQESMNNSGYLEQRECTVKVGHAWLGCVSLNEEELSSDAYEIYDIVHVYK